MAEKRAPALFERFGLVFATVLTVVALVIALLSFFALQERTEVAAQVLASDKLTTYHPELKASFTYAGEEVTHLWKVKVKFLNSGDKTLVGVGDIRNILGDGLNFLLPDETRILRVEEEADTFEGNIVQTKPNGFQIRFSQWRSGEYMVACLYVASDEPLAEELLPSVPSRDIVDGEVFIQDITEKRPEEQAFVINRLPGIISTSGKLIGGFIAGVVVIGLIILLVWGWMDTLKKFIWKRRYLSSFLNYLNQLEPQLSKSLKEGFIKRSDKVPDKIWAHFEGKKIPPAGLAFDTKLEAALFTIGSLVMAFGLSCLVLMLIPL